jgi:hypothetical protein
MLSKWTLAVRAEIAMHEFCSLYTSGDAIRTISEHETAQRMFSVLIGYIDEKQIPWDRMVGFCTDGAPSMAGLCTLVMNVSPSAIWTHCMARAVT